MSQSYRPSLIATGIISWLYFQRKLWSILGSTTISYQLPTSFNFADILGSGSLNLEFRN
jgi:hypothetical protein